MYSHQRRLDNAKWCKKNKMRQGIGPQNLVLPLCAKRMTQEKKKANHISIFFLLHRSPDDITQRLDKLIHTIREKYHRPVLENSSKDPNATGDVLIVAHGHILRALALRWSGMALDDGPAFLLEAGGVGTLR
jgi:broad specificity phosphatase PhoE